MLVMLFEVGSEVKLTFSPTSDASQSHSATELNMDLQRSVVDVWI